MSVSVRRPLIAVLLCAAAAAAPVAARAAPPTYLSLSAALELASRSDPRAAAGAARMEAADASVRQAGVKPNPTLNTELENFGGWDQYSMLDSVEATLSYQRTLERGGKREARTGLARAEREAVRLKAEVQRLDYLRDVQVAYAEALAAEAELAVAEGRLAAAKRSEADIARRVKSARDPLFAGSRAEALSAQAAIARDQAVEAAKAARMVLAAYLGGSPDFALDPDDFFRVAPPAAAPPEASPDLALLEAEREVAAAGVRVEQARSVADTTVRAGVRYLGQGSAMALVVGGSIPLQAGGYNRANVERAAAERRAADQEVGIARLTRERELARLIAQMSRLASEAQRIEAEVIPKAARTVEQVTEGFNRGGFQYIDVTEAERALADARSRRVEVLRQHHIAKAELDRLNGANAPLAALNEERP